MKLIRLTTNNTKGYFDNIFRQEIILPPMSKIALHSLTAEIDTEEFIIDAQNDVIEFKMTQQEDVYRVINIQHGTFNSSNYGELFNDISVKLNMKMKNLVGELGKQWRVVTEDATKKVNFQLQLGSFVAPTSNNFTNITGTKNCNYITTGGGSWGRNGGTASTQDAFLYINSPQCKAASSFRGRIFRTTQDGFVLAYLKSPPNNTTTLINTADIVFGVRMVRVGDPYKYIINGVEFPSTVIATVDANINFQKNNDYISIEASEGAMNGVIYRDNLAPITLFSTPYDHATNLYPVAIFEGDNTARIYGLKFTSDPYYNIKNEITMDPDIDLSIVAGGSSPSIKTLRFLDADLALFLGYKKTDNISPFADDWDLISDKPFTPSDFSDSFVVELQNLNVDSNDGLVGGHFNILEVIPQADIIRQRLTYRSPNLIFLNINNPYQISLSRLRARLLREDLSETALTGFACITVIIDDGK